MKLVKAVDLMKRDGCPEDDEAGTKWMESHGVPLLVHCTACLMTMPVVAALVDEETGLTYCGCTEDAEKSGW